MAREIRYWHFIEVVDVHIMCIHETERSVIYSIIYLHTPIIYQTDFW